MKEYILLIWAILVSIATPVSAQDFFDDEEQDNEETITKDSLAADSVITDNTLPWPINLQNRINRLISNKMFETSQLGLMIYDLTADSVLYRHNERQMLRPASTMKMFTAVAAIDRLGGSYQFRTSLYYTGSINNKTLQGDVYCVGGFDPRFNSDDMNAFIESIQRMGIDTIRGRIVADMSMKDDNMLGEGWCWDDDNPILSPLIYQRKNGFIEKFVSELKEQGIVVDAYTTVGALPNGAYAVCTRFHTIDQILMKMMKESDNLYAEAMFYQLAASTGVRPATAKHAATLMKRLIGKLGLANNSYKIADGCGLSLYNYLSAELEVNLLRYAYINNNIFVHLYPSLPIAGQDGTLRNRMRSTHASGNVHAKTGSVTGISTLAGYCTAPNGHILCFAIMNQGIMHSRNARVFQDRICDAMCRP